MIARPANLCAYHEGLPQDFVAITALMTDGNPARLTVADITKDSMRQAFAAYAREHEAVSIRRCRSTWNVLCTMSAVSGVGAELLRPNSSQRFKQSTHCVRHVFVWSNQREKVSQPWRGLANLRPLGRDVGQRLNEHRERFAAG